MSRCLKRSKEEAQCPSQALHKVYSRLIVLPISARWHRWIGLSIETSAYKTVLKESFSDLTPGGGQMPRYRLKEPLTWLRTNVSNFLKTFHHRRLLQTFPHYRHLTAFVAHASSLQQPLGITSFMNDESWHHHRRHCFHVCLQQLR